VSRDPAKGKTHDRALIEGACEATGKLRFATRKAAKVNLRQMGDRDMGAYMCSHCGGFHMGHESAKGRASLREHGL
jgi:hypothetical protein